jgi:uncharacterized protein (DUF433 family)
MTMQVADKYVVERDGNLYVGDTRVQVQGVIAQWQHGLSPEEVQRCFPHVPLVAVYATITYYLEHREELDAFFHEQDELFARLKAESEAKNPEFYAMMRERFARYRAERARKNGQGKSESQLDGQP